VTSPLLHQSQGLAGLKIGTQYRTGENNPLVNFYEPCLAQANQYDRAVGYFRSSIFIIVGNSLLEFAKQGGKMRLVCSPSITEQDAEAIRQGYVERETVIQESVKRDIDQIFSNAEVSDHARLLATLIKSETLDIRFAVRVSGIGIYHEKIGIFQDASRHRVSFLGSANETWNAWHTEGNHESIEVFRDWVSQAEFDRVTSHAEHFGRLWNGLAPGVSTLPFPEVEKQRLLQIAVDSVFDLPQIGQCNESVKPPKKMGSVREPLAHQKSAIDAWEQLGRNGIFEHATGSGKTYTAIIAIQRHLDKGGVAVVLVPSQLLLKQWRSELETDIPDATLLVAGGGFNKWKEKLRSHTLAGLEIKRIVLVTMQTASTDTFLNKVEQGDHLLLVADEVHQIGSAQNSKAMDIKSGASLGLSATPTRYGDPEGTAKIFQRFGQVIPPPITLQDAIRMGRLVEYEYHPHSVHLNEDEAAEWKKITKQISLEIARSCNTTHNAKGLSERAKLLLIRRSRLAKKAAIKPGLAVGVIKKEFEDGQSWLVYCEDSDQLKEIMKRLSEVGLSPVEYHTSMEGEKSAALEWFKKFGGILVSIKCLDEGIDIPAISHAFILASSQNPRQFIQRRGRVLRKSSGKHVAVIHDAIVVPVSAEETEQTSLLKAELLRALEFSEHAINKDASAELRSIAIDMNLDLTSMKYSGFEEDQNE
jgi:superfamily II DNA or RNA helicase